MKINILQTDIIWENISENIKRVSRIIDNSDTVDLIILPEMFATGFTMKPAIYSQALDDSIVQFLKQKASEKNTALFTSFACRENKLYYNRSVFVFPSGEIVSYDKRHLFSYAGEDKHYVAGTKRVIINYKGFRIMPQICYDLRFPVWSRLCGDYDLLVYIANWPQRRRNAWRTLLQARAHENQAYVVGVNRVGQDGNGIEHSGDSMIIDPLGNLLADLSSGNADTAIVKLDIKQVSDLRERFPASKDADSFVIKKY